MDDLTKQIQDILTRRGNYIHGRDSEDTGMTYTSIIEWKEESGMISSSPPDENTTQQNSDGPPNPPPTHDVNEYCQQWYKTGYDYWEDESKCPATVDGVLGGFAVLSKRDMEGSAKFIRYLKSNIRPELKLTQEENGGIPTRACECGAGM